MNAWYGRVTTKRQRHPQNVGGRNGDQYGTTVREGVERKKKKKKKAGREADGGREAWRSDRGRERAKDGHSLTVQDGREGGRREKGTREAG